MYLERLVGALKWEIPSSDGNQTIRCAAEGTDRGELYASRITIVRQYWDRMKFGTGSGEAETVLDHALELGQVILQKNKLQILCRCLREWLDQPFAFDVDLGASSDQELWLSFGPRPELISTIDRPVCTLRYTDSRLNFETLLIVDQSCIRLFMNDLQSWI